VVVEVEVVALVVGWDGGCIEMEVDVWVADDVAIRYVGGG